jgi:site-specific DNA-methyltransferase (adenine-specific)
MGGCRSVTPYFEEKGITIYLGDCREILPLLPAVDVTVADPPYGQTSLLWDRKVNGWASLVDSPVLWSFGSFRFFLEQRDEFADWKFAQDIVWRKHNGSSFHADRFRRIHEHAVQFYKGKWADIYKRPVTTPDATKRTRRDKKHPPHMGNIEASPYRSFEGGPRLQRSVIDVRSCHGFARHPTEKPVDIIIPLIQYSTPPQGLILDPFCGSGSTLEAAHRLNRQSIGIEINERFAEIAALRMRALEVEAA